LKKTKSQKNDAIKRERERERGDAAADAVFHFDIYLFSIE